MKKFLALLLALVLICLCVPVSFASETEIAYSTKSSIYIDGEKIEFDSYIINDQSYFKLRDIAYALTESDKGFSVEWDAEKEEISLFSKAPYSKVGGELELGDGTDKTAVKAVSGVFVDGKWVEMSSYNINGNNYFWLRDIGKALDFNVYWMEELSSIFVDSSSSYTGTYTGADDDLYTILDVNMRTLFWYDTTMDIPEFLSATELNVAKEEHLIEEDAYVHLYDLSAYSAEEIKDKVSVYMRFIIYGIGGVNMPNGFLGLEDSNDIWLLTEEGRMLKIIYTDAGVGVKIYKEKFTEEEASAVSTAVAQWYIDLFESLGE